MWSDSLLVYFIIQVNGPLTVTLIKMALAAFRRVETLLYVDSAQNGTLVV